MSILTQINYVGWSLAGLLVLIKGLINDDPQIITIGILAFILAWIIRMVANQEKHDE